MEIQSWMVSLATSGVIGIATYATIITTLKNRTEQNGKDITKIEGELKDEVKKLKDESTIHNKEDIAVHSKIFEKIDKALEELAKHKVQLANVPSSKDIDDKFVSKEFFKQVQSNIDNKIETTEKHINDKIDILGKSIEKSMAQVLSNQMDLANKIEQQNKDA